MSVGLGFPWRKQALGILFRFGEENAGGAEEKLDNGKKNQDAACSESFTRH